MILHIDGPAICVDCGKEIPAAQKKACEFINATYLCEACRNPEDEKNRRLAHGEKKKPEEIKMNREQQARADENLGEVVDALPHEFLHLQATPEIRGYTHLEKIGQGGFGLVYKARRVSDGETVALKTMLQTRKPPKRLALFFEREKESRYASGGIGWCKNS